MLCYIRIADGQPVGNPIVPENMAQAFPDIDLNNLPSGWAPFNRIEQPVDLLTSPFQVAVCTYTLSSDGVAWQDTWTAQEVSADEKAAIIAAAQANPPPFPNLTSNINTLVWEPNIPMPPDGKTYRWKRATGDWVIVTSQGG